MWQGAYGEQRPDGWCPCTKLFQQKYTLLFLCLFLSVLPQPPQPSLLRPVMWQLGRALLTQALLRHHLQGSLTQLQLFLMPQSPLCLQRA